MNPPINHTYAAYIGASILLAIYSQIKLVALLNYSIVFKRLTH